MLVYMLACDRPCSSGRSAGAYTILPGASLREAKPPSEREGKLLRSLDLTISVCGLSVGRYQTLSLMPMLRSDRDSVVMAPVVLNGANKQKMYDRTLVFEGKKAADGDAYTVIKNTPELIREIPYELSIPYHPWMKNAALILVGELDNYEGAPLRTFVNVLTEHLDIP